PIVDNAGEKVQIRSGGNLDKEIPPKRLHSGPPIRPAQWCFFRPRKRAVDQTTRHAGPHSPSESRKESFRDLHPHQRSFWLGKSRRLPASRSYEARRKTSSRR